MSRFANLEWKEPDPPPGKRRSGDSEEPASPNEPRDEAHYTKLAAENFGAGRFEKALRYYTRALEYNPNLRDGWIGQVRCLLALGELDEARLWSEKGLDVHRDDADLLAARAVATARQGDLEKALAFTDLAMKQKGGSPFVWLARGEVLLAGRRSNHGHCFDKARIESRGDPLVTLLAARCYLFYGDEAHALEWAQKATSADPARAFSWATLGLAQEAAGLFDEAGRSLARARSLDLDCPEVEEALARMASRGPLDRLWARVRRWFGSARRPS